MKNQLEKAKNSALRFLTYRSRSEYELRTRMKKYGYQNDIIEQVISFLKDYNYINDLDFAMQWVRNRMALKPVGPIRLRWELQQKGIAQDIINNMLDSISREQEYDLALELITKKYANKDSAYSKNQIASFLKRRGFSPGVVLSICNNIENKDIMQP